MDDAELTRRAEMNAIYMKANDARFVQVYQRADGKWSAALSWTANSAVMAAVEAFLQALAKAHPEDTDPRSVVHIGPGCGIQGPRGY